MKMSNLIRCLIDYILQYGDRDVLTVQYHDDSDTKCTYGDIGKIVDYEDGTVGLLGDVLGDLDIDSLPEQPQDNQCNYWIENEFDWMCPNCNHNFDEWTRYCPDCGKELYEKDE
jgi:hypothetical protein